MRALVHDSAGVPPQAVWIRPTGTPRACCTARPKKKPTAGKSGAVSGVHTVQVPFTSVSGVGEVTSGT